uniref:Uncharacterized protein n=1 Tax=Anguilla anguilla TaxID=7936 RepID=A0A0E9WRQ6_ANGAN
MYLGIFSCSRLNATQFKLISERGRDKTGSLPVFPCRGHQFPVFPKSHISNVPAVSNQANCLSLCCLALTVEDFYFIRFLDKLIKVHPANRHNK